MMIIIENSLIIGLFSALVTSFVSSFFMCRAAYWNGYRNAKLESLHGISRLFSGTVEARRQADPEFAAELDRQEAEDAGKE